MSSFGHYFKVTAAGESHGKSVSCIIENCPPNLALTEADIQPQRNRRRPEQVSITTPRNEKDRTIDLYPRPSHADWRYLEKYGIKPSSGGGGDRSSACETIGRVAAEKWLREAYGVETVAFVSSVGAIKLFGDADPVFLSLAQTLTRADVDAFLPVRCPHDETSRRMEARIAELTRRRRTAPTAPSLASSATPPPGLSEPCFDKLQATLGHARCPSPSSSHPYMHWSI